MGNQKNLNNNNFQMLKCIWMSSGVVDYKLCDNNFDCENCLYDNGIRKIQGTANNAAESVTGIISEILNKMAGITFDSKIIYLKNHLIARQILPDNYYLGIDPVLISFIDHPDVTMELGTQSNISSEQVIMNFSGEWGKFTLTSPINYFNYDYVNNPLNSKWFAMIKAEESEIKSASLNFTEWNLRHQSSIKIIEEIKSSYPYVGPTMYDGGRNVKDLYQIVGKKKYLELLELLASENNKR